MAISASMFALFTDGVRATLPALSTNISTQKSNKFHASQAMVLTPPTAKANTSSPLPTYNRAAVLAAGGHKPTQFDDYYNRIHISTALLALGNVVSQQNRSIYIWNAWLTKPVTLASVSAVNAGGISVGQPGATPLVFAILQERIYTVAAATAGPPVIAASLTWNFGADGTVSVTITGNRVTAWTIGPDWTNQLTESFEFLTDLEKSYDGTEVRTQIRSTPRRSWAYTAMAWQNGALYMENALFAWNKRIWALPVWTDLQPLPNAVTVGQLVIPCTTTDLDFVAGGLAILLRDPQTYEVLLVLSVQTTGLTLSNGLSNNWDAGTKLYPMRKAWLTSDPALNRITDNAWAANLSFISSEANAFPVYSGWTSYRGIPVLEDRMDWNIDPQMAFDRLSATIDNRTGLPVVYESGGFTQPLQGFQWRLFSKAARTKLKGMLYAMAGRVNILWLPTWNTDLTMAAVLAGTSTGMVVTNVGYTLFNSAAQNRRDIRVEIFDGTVFYCRILSSADLLDGTEQINLDSALGTTYSPSQIRRISFMAPVRFDTDRFDLVYDTDSITSLGTSFRGVKDNV